MASEDKCGMPLVMGGHCPQSAMERFPCCWNHIPYWVNIDFDHLRGFIESGIYDVPEPEDDRRIYTYEGIVHVFLYKKSSHLRKRRSSIDLRLPMNNAIVCADLFSSLGYENMARLILQAVDKHHAAVILGS